MSVAADPTPASRRRHVDIGQKTTGFDFAGRNTIAASPVTGKDHSRSVKAASETALKRSIDDGKIKGHSRPTTAKKSSSSKPLWKTILSVFIKNFLLLLVLVLLVQMFRKLAFNQLPGTDSLVVSSDYVNRFAELDDFLKTTTRMIQNRVDSVDQKIHKEIQGLKSELSHKIDENGGEFSIMLEELNGRVESVEKYLTSDSQWLSKHEFDTFVEEIKGYGNLGDLKLDEIRAFAKEIVMNEIEKHGADGIGRVDYAAAAGGATVVDHSDSVSGKVNWVNKIRVSGDSVKMLQPSFGEPGQCFPLKGDRGFVQIKLRTAIIPEAVTLEHVAKSVAFDRSSAPKGCRVFGWKDSEERRLLAEFVYDLDNKSNVQTFSVLESNIIDTVKLELTSNHGNPTHTCIYRFRVHGHEPSSLALRS